MSIFYQIDVLFYIQDVLFYIQRLLLFLYAFFYVEGMRGSQRTYVLFEKKTEFCPFYELHAGGILAIQVNCFSLWHLCC